MRNGERPKLNRNDYVFFTKKRIKKLLESKYTKRQSKVSALSLSLMTHWSKSSRYVAVGFEENHPEIHTHTGHTPRITFFLNSYCDKTLIRDSRKHGWDYTILDKMELSGKMNLKYECHIDRKYSSQHWGGTPLNFPITQPNVQEKKTKSQNVKSVKRPSLFSKPPTVSFGFTHRDAQS
jgi:hypothetical protein